MRDVAAIILAGGDGSRLGPLGEKTPKSLLPLRNGETLLSRLLDQLWEAQLPQVIVACSGRNYARIAEALALRDAQSGIVRALSCPNSSCGPLPALGDATRATTADWLLLCLGDIFFAWSPFPMLLRNLENSPDVDGWLLTGHEETSTESHGTGWIECEGARVKAVSYRQFPDHGETGELRRWTGTFLFQRQFAEVLYTDLDGFSSTPLEQWVHWLNSRNVRLNWLDAGTFVNVNTPADYELLLSRVGSPETQ